jgi:MFS family permease
MSNIPDIAEVYMSFEEKLTWVGLVVAIVVPIVYFSVVLGRLGDAPAAEVTYQWPLIIAIAASLVLMIVGAIVMAIATAAAVEITGKGSIADIDKKDERDVHIGRRGELAGYYASSVGVVAALVLTLLESDYFWIANALYLGFVAAAIVSAVVKLSAYRRGF